MISRAEVLRRLRAKIAAGVPIIGGGAGNGLNAKFQEAGGIDLIIIYNSGKYRCDGLGSLAGMLPFGDATEVMLEMAPSVIPAVRNTPVIAGVFGVDPRHPPERLIPRLIAEGFSGVQNYPTVGLIDGDFGINLEESGFSYEHEVRWIAAANQAGLLTTPYAFNLDHARRMTEAGADVVVAHMGLTSGGSIGARTVVSLDECVTRIAAIATAAKSVREDVIVLCHGGPLAEPADAKYILDRVEAVAGFYGASSMERLPVETAMAGRVRDFLSIRRTPVV